MRGASAIVGELGSRLIFAELDRRQKVSAEPRGRLDGLHHNFGDVLGGDILLAKVA